MKPKLNEFLSRWNLHGDLSELHAGFPFWDGAAQSGVLRLLLLILELIKSTDRLMSPKESRFFKISRFERKKQQKKRKTRLNFFSSVNTSWIDWCQFYFFDNCGPSYWLSQCLSGSRSGERDKSIYYLLLLLFNYHYVVKPYLFLLIQRSVNTRRYTRTHFNT